MCSNMCARPVLPIGSCTDPASTCVKNENTGASGRSQIMMVSSLASFFTVVRFSKEARSWPRASEHSTKQTTNVCIEVKRDFILPPKRNNAERQKFEVTWRQGRLSNEQAQQNAFTVETRLAASSVCTTQNYCRPILSTSFFSARQSRDARGSARKRLIRRSRIKNA